MELKEMLTKNTEELTKEEIKVAVSNLFDVIMETFKEMNVNSIAAKIQALHPDDISDEEALDFVAEVKKLLTSDSIHDLITEMCDAISNDEDPSEERMDELKENFYKEFPEYKKVEP